MGISFVSFFFIIFFFLLTIFSPAVVVHATRDLTYGGHGGRDLLQSSSPPYYSGFESKRLELVYPVIQRFKERIKYDPKGITKTWVGYDICGKYKGFICDIVPDYKEKALSGVKFNDFNFDGPYLKLDGFIEELPDIAFFHANSNNFTGTVPEKVTELRFFFELDLSNNKLSGKFPEKLLSAKNLTILDLRYNSFTGSVPNRAFNLDLDLLFINNNGFAQKVPENLWSTRAVYLTLANNGFSGEIPTKVGSARDRLREVLFLNNNLEGCLPIQMGTLKKARVFGVGRNKLTGPIPYSFGCLKKIQNLNFRGNELYGAIPEVVCKLKSLRNATLTGNYFTEVGPICKSLIERKILHVDNNCIYGLPNQRSSEECHKFFSKPPKKCPKDFDQYWMPCSNDTHYTAPTSPPPPAPTPKTYHALNPRNL
ncbi:uncharacterized protein At4g06744-like [Impatiens glandulifera]|uniref:uncharacterized protein At4g06744-like n=1 Tax=Impatiens glandulifera TaxID=253017 RepID=UPI001FB05240|nr:uncharacterized protein At4g06744-like [Impatiens glandulifera]